MKIVYLTAGAGGMFCGSCINDNALAKELIELGCDCLLVPVYTPIRTDSDDVSSDQVFMGGINVYLQQKMPWLAYLPKWVDRFLNSPRLIKSVTKNIGKTLPTFLGALTVSMLKGLKGNQRKEFARLVDWLEKDVVPDALILTNLLIGGGCREIKRRCGSRIYVTLQGDDIFIDSLPDPYKKQTIDLLRELVSEIDGFIIHSHAYAKKMSEILNIPDSKLHVVPLGIPLKDFSTMRNVDGLSHASPSYLSNATSSKPDFTIGYLARLGPEKGFHKLVEAFIELAQNPDYRHVKLKIAGWKGPQHEDDFRRLSNKLNEAGLANRWIYEGSIDRIEKVHFLNSLDLFCVPTIYEEPKGLFLLEAVACGVPYLQPAHGAFPEIHQRLSKLSGEPLGHLFDPNSDADFHAKLELAIKNVRTKRPPNSRVQDEIDIVSHAKRIMQLISQPN